MNDAELDILLPSGRKLAELKTLQKHLGDFNLITLKLQDPSISLLEVRLIFDEVISAYHSMEFHLAQDAFIVKHPFFESAISCWVCVSVISYQEKYIFLGPVNIFHYIHKKICLCLCSESGFVIRRCNGQKSYIILTIFRISCKHTKIMCISFCPAVNY